ncbi:MAG: UDP-GlcNAc--UDP-phosphate GlcNAc-1-phosphate transferase, partial [Bacteroidota bacterium]
MIYILFFIILLSSIVYLNVAKKFGIIDKPNERSSHKKPTIRGGGILFSISALLFFLCYQFQYPFFIAGLLLVSIISFIDDIYTLKSSYRIVVQLIAIILTLYQVPYPDIQPFLLLMALFLITGMLNIFNFMDGINGITGLYGITTISSLLYVDRFITDFIDHHLLVLALFSLIVFGFYNFRVKAKMFAGDIGSISIGLIIIFGLSLLLVKTQNLMYLMFVLVYMLDGGCTIIQRAYSKENIFKPHR